MPRTVRDSNLETRTARLRLAPRPKPYFRLVDVGLHLGYRRKRSAAGSWLARIYVGEQRYRVERIALADDLRDADGHGILTFAQAQKEARGIAARAVAAEHGQAAPATVADVVEAYLAWLEAHRKPTTVRESRYAARAHIIPAFGKLEIAKLTTAQIRRWHEALATAPARLRSGLGEQQKHRSTAHDPEVARARRSTANRVLTVLKAALNHAHQEGVVGSDDAWRRVKPFRGADAARVRWLSEDECRRLLNACPDDLETLVRGALLTGCRYGELGQMSVADFGGEAQSIQVRESKAGRPRWIPLDEEGAAFFQHLTAGRQAGDRIFQRAGGRVWTKSDQTRPLEAACRAAQIDPPANFHALRHTFASHRVMRGMPLLVVAQILGHADTRMVEKHYGHLAPSYVRDAVQATAMNLGASSP